MFGANERIGRFEGCSPRCGHVLEGALAVEGKWAAWMRVRQPRIPQIRSRQPNATGALRVTRNGSSPGATFTVVPADAAQRVSRPRTIRAVGRSSGRLVAPPAAVSGASVAGHPKGAGGRGAVLPSALVELPARAPFTIRARLITPLSDGSTRHEPDAVLVVDAMGRITRVAASRPGTPETDEAIDLRPFLVVPGLVDLHAHLPQLPNAGIGFGMDLLAWLERHIFPLERHWADPAIAERVAPAAFRAMAGAGTTTVLAYGAVYEESLDAAFRAAEAHGIRAVLGKVMMDRVTYDERRSPGSPELTELSLRQSADLCSRWHGRDGGRLRYAFTPRFAIACTADLLRESATLARDAGATWQTHLSEDRGEIEAVKALFPDATDYVDVYDRAGGVGPNAVFAHAVHLSDRELARLIEAGAHVAHCPGSNLFLASGVMPLARYLAAGLSVGMGSDVAAGPEVSIWSSMRIGAYCQNAWRVMLDDEGGLPEVRDALDDPSLLVSRLMFRASSTMIRGTYVRGRRLATSA
jgi:guanine deaminase